LHFPVKRIVHEPFLRFVGLLLVGLWLPSHAVDAQSNYFPPADTLHQTRLKAIGISTGVIYGGALVGLNQLWYNQYERSRFHWTNELNYWQQMDKAGHAYSAYYESLAAYHLLRWSGVTPDRSLWYGGLAGFALQTPIEVLDGFSKKWGASAGDMAANAFGSALFIGQRLAWDRQVLQMKFSHAPSSYAGKRPNILGSNPIQEVIKDYNSQTYWLSVAFNDLVPKADPLPPWLSIASGYGAKGMLGNNNNPSAYDDIKRHRTYKLALAINPAKLHTSSRFLNTLLDALSAIKLPLPGLQYDRVKGFRGQIVAY
jgi:hypothetical protein